MVIVKIHYGLGNQLFQYAIAKSLRIKLNYNVKLDLSFYSERIEDQHPRPLLLDSFNIKLISATASDLQVFRNISLLRRSINRLFNLFKPYYKRRIVYEKNLKFDANIFKINNKSYLMGYWQDERYFFECAEEVRKDLVFKEVPTGLNAVLFKEIKLNLNSVCIHIRRGDYLTDPFALEQIGVCNIDFYRRAIELLVQHVKSPFFYVFSDEPEWVKNNFTIPFPYKVIEHNLEADAAEDLRLMSACRHQIISNSSFGWWAAWLNNYISKIVIAPKVWRKNGPEMFTPKGWQRI